MNNTTRRGFIKSASLTAATAAIPATALAYQVPATDEPPELPDWWKKLAGPTAATDPEVYHPWQDTQMTRELARKLEDLREFLLFMGVPEKVNAITELRLRWCNGVPQGVTVTGRSGPNNSGLHQYRPEFGWADRSVRIAGTV